MTTHVGSWQAQRPSTILMLVPSFQQRGGPVYVRSQKPKSRGCSHRPQVAMPPHSQTSGGTAWSQGSGNAGLRMFSRLLPNRVNQSLGSLDIGMTADISRWCEAKSRLGCGLRSAGDRSKADIGILCDGCAPKGTDAQARARAAGEG